MTPEVKSTVDSSFWRRPKNLEKNTKLIPHRGNIFVTVNSEAAECNENYVRRS